MPIRRRLRASLGGVLIALLHGSLLVSSATGLSPTPNTRAQSRATIFLPLATATCFPRLLFGSSVGDDRAALFTINGDGANRQQVPTTGVETVDFAPAWSPDGRRIAFASRPFRQGSNIVVMNADGSNRQQPTTSGRDSSPAWSPDGTRIAFVSGREGGGVGDGPYIYIMNVDGSEQRRVTTRNGLVEDDPAWSPDGRITFTLGSKYASIYTVQPDGTGLKLLIPELFMSDDFHPAWSPDGTRIAFASNRDGNNEIYIAQADGSGITRLTNNFPASDLQPSWSPDGQYLVFGSNRGGDVYQYQLFRMNTDGSDVVQLTRGAASVSGTHWYPRLGCAASPS